MHTWKYNGAEYECDICDYDSYEKLDGALTKLMAEMRGIDEPENGVRATVGEKLKRSCEVIGDFFASMFGQEAREKICGDRLNLLNHSGALADFLCYIESELQRLTESGEKLKNQLLSRIGNLGNA